jgi:hypothetical protein
MYFKSYPKDLKASYSRKDWKVVLKEWLILLGSLKNAVSYFNGVAVKEVLVNRYASTYHV